MYAGQDTEKDASYSAAAALGSSVEAASAGASAAFSSDGAAVPSWVLEGGSASDEVQRV